MEIQHCQLEFYDSTSACIFCSTPLTPENSSRDHVFPEVIGGRLTVRMTCRTCNSAFGISFDSDLRKNGYVHAAIQALGLSDASRHLIGQRMSWESEQGHSGRLGVPRGYTKPVIIPSLQPDGSVIADEEFFIKEKSKELRGRGWSEEHIRTAFVEKVRTAPIGIAIPLMEPDGNVIESIVRHSSRLTLYYDDMNAPIRFALISKIALELYLAFGFGFVSRFDTRELIDAIRMNDPTPFCIVTPAIDREKSVYDLHYCPFHYAAFAVLQQTAVASIGLFGVLNYAIALGKTLDSVNGDWNSEFWAFPVASTDSSAEITRLRLPPSLLAIEIARMEEVAGMYRNGYRNSQTAALTSGTQSAPR
ncbi:MAG TPA: HNH endonuclease [bacterium]|nr:HNH endonuclease [bacterium]